jgi:hypothetical protein
MHTAYHVTFKEAMRMSDTTPGIVEAATAEINNMITNKVLAPVHESYLRSDEKAIPAHMFFTLKTKADGSFDKVKARIVANGNQQEKDDIGDTYAPTVNAISIFMLLHMAVNEDMV